MTFFGPTIKLNSHPLDVRELAGEQIVESSHKRRASVEQVTHWTHLNHNKADDHYVRRMTGLTTPWFEYS
jgi:hypothetical protein